MNDKKREEINTQRAMLDYTAPLDYGLLMRYIEIMSDRYKELSVTYIGESILGRGIPMLTIGEGEKQTLYVAGHSGDGWLGSILLLRFINEFCEVLKNDGRIYNYSVKYLFGTRRICIVPMLNPDGVDICLNGVSEENILRDRIISMNGGKNTSGWQSNARGVSLIHNYSHGFAEYKAVAASSGILSGARRGYCGEMPESEPEVGALCAHVRFSEKLMAAICLHGFGERVFYRYGDSVPKRGRSIGEAICRMSGYRLQGREEELECGGFLALGVKDMNIPTFNVAYGNEKSYTDVSSYFEAYSKLREALFTLPILI